MCTDDFDIRQALTEAYKLGLATARAGYRGDATHLIDADGSNVVSIERRERVRRAEDRRARPVDAHACAAE